MIKEFNFEEKVKSMTANDIVAVMVEGLRNPVTRIYMGSYGGVHNDGFCYGCAATNAICKIANVTTEEFTEGFDEATYLSFGSKNLNFLGVFESAINFLRLGNIFYYNDYAKSIGIAQMKEIEGLPELGDDYTEEQLQEYLKHDYTI